MDTGIQLGRRFRALKLWMVLRYFGADGIRARLAEHIRLARLFARWVDDDADFERLAPVPFSVVCFRARPAAAGLDEAGIESLNERLLESINATGEIYISHTRLEGRYRPAPRDWAPPHHRTACRARLATVERARAPASDRTRVLIP